MVVHWHGAEAQAHMRAAAARGLNKAATVLKVASQERAPVDTTDLRKSAATHDATSANLESAVTYDTPYAVIQHERLDFNHPTDHNPNAQAKYLEGPAREMRDQLAQIVATEIKREMRS